MRRLRGSAALVVSLSIVALSGVALASTGIDSPENGIEQMSRGSAWVARADTPLAAYYNPAALAYQGSGIYFSSHIMFRTQCFTRRNEDGSLASPDQGIPGPGVPGGPYAPVCADGGPFLNPQLAGSWRITKKLGIGFAMVGPHAYGKVSWAEALSYGDPSLGLTQPAPGRYMLESSDSLIFFPTLGVGFSPIENLAVGAAFMWGLASLDIVNFSEATSAEQMVTPPVDRFVQNGDLRAELKAKDLFVPGFVLSALWSPTQNLDVAAAYKWTDSIRTSTASVYVQSRYWDGNSGRKAQAPCQAPEAPDCNITDEKDIGTLKFALPMEARIGMRFHMPRPDPEKLPFWVDPKVNGDKKVRDGMSQDLFDVEINFTWANNSAVDKFHLSFPANIPVHGTPGQLPVNGDLDHNWKDVVGVRLGGEYVVVPNVFALRAGGWFESKGQDDAHLLLDFDVAQKVGVAGGVGGRLGPVDLNAGYQHTFYGYIDNGGKGVLHGLSGDALSNFRSQQAVNGGRLTTSLNEFGFSANLHF